MTILENINEKDLINSGCGTYYFKKENMKIWIGSNQIRITDLSNALSRGKDVLTLSVGYYNLNSSDFWNWLNDEFDNSLEFLFKFYMLQDNEDEYGQRIDHSVFEIYISRKKGIRVFSPFAIKNMKPLKSSPKKWNISHVIKALLNNQFEGLKCDGVYTDDYAFDAAYNFQKGQVVDGGALKIAKDLIESPSGWWVYMNDRNEVDFNCHHFKGYSFKFIVNPKEVRA